MATKKRSSRKTAVATVVAEPQRAAWPVYAAIAAAILLALWAYSPAIHGPFLFDDNVLPFALPNADAPLGAWLHNVRPLLMFTYWMNARISGDDTYSYHIVNILLHLISSGLIFFIVRRLLEWSGVELDKGTLLSGFAAALFLLHPVQTEAVAYLAGRSDGLSVMLVLAAYAVFLYRRETAVSWRITAAVFLIFGASLLAKEHTIVLPALLLLTDFWWNPGFSFEGIRRNWRLYAPMVLAGVAGVAYFLPLILYSPSAGFRLKDLTWYQYLFTQFRALFVYPGLFLFPVHQTADWNFPISHTILDGGAILGLIVWLALAVLAWRTRKSWKLASFGFFAWLLLMAPTSSILPIRDAVAERRLYLSMLGLLLIAVDALSRIKWQRTVLVTGSAALALVLAAATHARAEVWSSELALWQDTASKAPSDYRPHFWLASAYYNQGRCDLSAAEYENTARIKKPDYNLLVDWALAYDCLNQPDKALAKLREAAKLEPTAHVYSQIGMIYGKRSQWEQALDALTTAEKIDPNFAMTHVYKGLVHLNTNQPEAAVQDYQRALALDPKAPQAKEGLAEAQTRLLASH
jgi:tetratricopeptide (TPR) repeat protein